MKNRDGIQEGFDWLDFIRKPVLAVLLVLVSTVGASAGINDGPEPVGVVVDDGVPFNSGEFSVDLQGPTLDTASTTCGYADIDNCWRDCEVYADSQGSSYFVKRVDCRIRGGAPACTCTIGIPGPYHPPIYWPGITPILSY